MVRLRRTTTTALIACLLATASPVFAADERRAVDASATSLTLNGAPLDAIGTFDVERVPALRDENDQFAFGQFGRFGRGRRHRNDGAAVALFLGAVGTIAGAAVLVYANRPECSAAVQPGGCGYGTKVVGGSVLAAGLVGLTIGAVTWR